jgi:hypothetical protein
MVASSTWVPYDGWGVVATDVVLQPLRRSAVTPELRAAAFDLADVEKVVGVHR